MPLLVYVGTYTSGKSDGIYVYEMDAATGELSSAGLTGGIENPSFLAVDAERRRLFAVHELAGPREAPEGQVSAYAIESRTGALAHLNTTPTHGGCPCHVVVDPTGQTVIVANYLYGKVSVHGVRPDGGLSPAQVLDHQGTGPDAGRQEESHPHSTTLDLAGRYAFVADLGADKLWTYRLGPAAPTLTPADPPSAEVAPGTGPRHMAFHPSGTWAWVIGELSNTVTTLAYDAGTGRLTPGGSVSTLPDGFTGTSHTADIHVHPTGRWVYGSNRGHDSLVAYTVDEADGTLHDARLVSTGGRNPRNFGIDPSGRWLLAANQDTDSIVTFAIDPDTGDLSPTGAVRETPTPVCVRFVEL